MKHKDYYDDQYIQDFSEKLASVMPDFDQDGFTHNLIGQLDDKELFARFDCIVNAMRQSMGSDYSKNIEAFFYGNENWELSLSFLKELTKRFTGEYAIRPLLKEHPAEVMEELIIWTKDKNVHVRRLASEGVRIRLPWSQKLFVALNEFEKYSAILTNLKDAPAVPGWTTWRQIDRENSMNVLQEHINDLKVWGYLGDTVDIELMTYSISGALNELALNFAQTETGSNDKITDTITQLVHGFRKI